MVGSRGRRRLGPAAALAMVTALVLSSCGTEEQPTEPPEETGPVGEVGVSEGFWRDSSLPEPIAETTLSLPAPEDDREVATAKLQILSADSDGDFTRLVMAWLPPEQGVALGSIVLSSHKHRYEATPFVRLADREAGELIEPLRGESNNFRYDQDPQIEQSQTHTSPASDSTAGNEMPGTSETPIRADPVERPGRGTCICSMLSGAEEEPPDRTELIYLDFPTPETEVVDVVPGEWAEPIGEVPITTAEPFSRPDEASSWFFTHAAGEDPPQQYGAGAQYQARYPIAARTESLSGMVTTIEEETQEVSLPADVLFEFGSAQLSDEAEGVIESAAEKLNEEASGLEVTVEGHTDDVGSEQLNQELSEDRAAAVYEVIEGLLDDSISLETIGYGFSRPQVPNTDADGEPIPENQEQNRRVSFRYPVVVQEAGMEVDLGEVGIPDLPEARGVSAAEGAEASFVLEAPQGDTSEADLRFDVIEAERAGDLVTMRFALASVNGVRHQGTVFSGNPNRGGGQHFGRNSQGDGDSPGVANMSLIDIESERRFYPLSSGDMGCLCTEVAGTVETLPVEQSPMYAQFHLPTDLQPPVVVHLPDAGQFELPQSTLEQITAADDSGADGE